MPELAPISLESLNHSGPIACWFSLKPFNLSGRVDPASNSNHRHVLICGSGSPLFDDCGPQSAWLLCEHFQLNWFHKYDSTRFDSFPFRSFLSERNWNLQSRFRPQSPPHFNSDECTLHTSWKSIKTVIK